jgi:hypothetical protein
VVRIHANSDEFALESVGNIKGVIGRLRIELCPDVRLRGHEVAESLAIVLADEDRRDGGEIRSAHSNTDVPVLIIVDDGEFSPSLGGEGDFLAKVVRAALD